MERLPEIPPTPLGQGACSKTKRMARVPQTIVTLTGRAEALYAAAALVLILAFGPGAMPYRALAQGSSERYTIGATLSGGQRGCPIFVGGVSAKSPAHRAGVRSGDRLLAVNGTDVTHLSLRQTADLTRSKGPEAVTLTLSHGVQTYKVTVEPEKYSSIAAREGMKVAEGGAVVPLDTTDAEVRRMLEFDGSRIADRVFPLHYPTDTQLFCGGFEVFVLRDPDQVAVGGTEAGPASRAGVHWGDVVLSVSGTDPRGKTRRELEALFSSTRPDTVRLKVERLGSIKTFEFTLEKASDILQQNGLCLVGDSLVPAALPDDYIKCFTARE